MLYLTDFKAKHAGQPEGKRPNLDKESSGGSLSANLGEMDEINPGHRWVGSVRSMGSATYESSFPSLGKVPLAFTTAGNQVVGIRKAADTSPRAESPPSQLPARPKLRSAISTQSSTSDDSWASRRDQADAMQRIAQLSLVATPTVLQALSSLPPLEPSRSDYNVRKSSKPPDLPGHRDALPPMNSDTTTYQQYRTPMAGVPPAIIAEERWKMPDLPRTFHPPLTMGQTVSFGSAQLPPLVGPEQLSETQHDHLQHTLPPPRLLPPRDQARALPSLSRARTALG